MSAAGAVRTALGNPLPEPVDLVEPAGEGVARVSWGLVAVLLAPDPLLPLLRPPLLLPPLHESPPFVAVECKSVVSAAAMLPLV